MLDLSNISLVCVDCNKTAYESLWAIGRCIELAQFKDVLFFSDRTIEKIQLDYNPTIEHPKYNFETVIIPSICSKIHYSIFMMKDLNQFISSKHILTVQWDGFIINPNAWTPEFLNYDYIGAPWPWQDSMVVGNGGFSLRSKRLLEALQDPCFIPGHPEDVYICQYYPMLLDEKYGIQFAPVDLAHKFSTEHNEFDNQFGFHGQWKVRKYRGW